MTHGRRLVHTHLPYCIDRLPDGRWIVLNRSYKPVGTTTPVGTMVDYNAGPHPIAFKKGELDSETLQLMSTSLQRDPDGDVARAYFYSDGCVPTAGAAQMEAYLERLGTLASLQVDDTSASAR